MDGTSDVFQLSLDSAVILNPSNPHLRIVDVIPFEREWSASNPVPPTIVLSLVELVRAAIGKDVHLSLENSGLPLTCMQELICHVRGQLQPEEVKFIGLCIDPVNQRLLYPTRDPLTDLEAIPPDMIQMAHFKQCSQSNTLPTICDGDVDICKYLRILAAKH